MGEKLTGHVKEEQNLGWMASLEMHGRGVPEKPGRGWHRRVSWGLGRQIQLPDSHSGGPRRSPEMPPRGRQLWKGF